MYDRKKHGRGNPFPQDAQRTNQGETSGLSPRCSSHFWYKAHLAPYYSPAGFRRSPWLVRRVLRANVDARAFLFLTVHIPKNEAGFLLKVLPLYCSKVLLGSVSNNRFCQKEEKSAVLRSYGVECLDFLARLSISVSRNGCTATYLCDAFFCNSIS